MEKKKRLAGRFLPSRVYARWKWTVRFGLSALPLILFLAGAMTLYLSPGRYRSTAVFEYLGKRPVAEAADLLKTRNVVGPAASSLDLVNRMGVDSDTLFQILVRNTRTSVDARSGMIRVQVTDTRKDVARDLAAAMVTSLENYERSLVTAAIRQRLDLAGTELLAAEDDAEQKQQALARLVSLRGNDPQDPVSLIDVDAARAEWQHAQGLVLETRTRIAAHQRELANPGKWVVVHTQPMIASKPLKPEKSWGWLILDSLGTGLAFTLLVPYLLELAFPRVYRRGQKGDQPWSDEARDPELARQPA